MTRIILLLLLLASAVLAVSAAASAVAPGRAATAPSERSDRMPRSFRMIAYVLLLVLMFGVVTGWLGAA